MTQTLPRAAILENQVGAQPTSGRLEELDAFRGLAALWVVLFHLCARYPQLFAVQAPLDPFASCLAWMFTTLGGLAPVYGFFMISGFVITWTLGRSRTATGFLVSRASRLYPAYWTAVLLAAASAVAPLPGLAMPMSAVIAAPTMLQNFLGLPDLDGAWWSLAVELVFYGWMLLALLCGQLARLQLICLVWAAACLATHLLVLQGIDVPYRVQKYAMLQHGQCFAAGIMLHEIWRRRNAVLAGCVLVLCGVGILAACPLLDAAFCLAFMVVFLAAIGGRLHWIATRPLLWLGAISYSLYITHQTVGWRVIALLDRAGCPYECSVAMAIAVALLTATSITRWIERPAQRRLRELWRSTDGSAATPDRVQDGDCL